MVELPAFRQGAGGEAHDGHYPGEHGEGDACMEENGISLSVCKELVGTMKEGRLPVRHPNAVVVQA